LGDPLVLRHAPINMSTYILSTRKDLARRQNQATVHFRRSVR
jgi:hypothetical protein